MALRSAQATLAQNDAYHLTQLSQAYATANQYAMVQAQAHAASVQAQNPAAGNQRGIDPRLSPSRSHTAISDDTTLRYGLSPRQSNVPAVDLNIRPSAASAGSSTSPAKAGEEQVSQACLRRQGVQHRQQLPKQRPLDQCRQVALGQGLRLLLRRALSAQLFRRHLWSSQELPLRSNNNGTVSASKKPTK